MTVSGETNKITYQGNGSTTIWPFSFAIAHVSDIHIFVTNPAGTVTEVPSTGFSVGVFPPVDPNPTSIGGNVQYPQVGSPLPAGNSITIVRILPETQPVSISNQSIVYPPIVEQTFDRMTMIDQQISETLNRTVRVPVTEAPMAPLPPLAFRLGNPAVFDELGNLTAGAVPAGGLIISPAMVPVVTAGTLSLARSTMGVPGLDSPVFTGNAQSTNPPFNDNDASIATTSWVQGQLSGAGVIIPSGTLMLFQQTAAPTGWTKQVTHNDKALRVTATTAGSGVGLPFTTVFSRITTDPHTLTTLQMPSHAHPVNDPTHTHGVNDPTHNHSSGIPLIGTGSGSWDNSEGIDGQVTSLNPAYTGISIAANYSGVSVAAVGGSQSHSHGADMRVQYVDVIIASKD